MDEDTKLVLDAWRVLLVENHRLAGDCEALRERIHFLEEEHVRERIRTDDSFTDWRRAGRGRRRDLDSDD